MLKVACQSNDPHCDPPMELVDGLTGLEIEILKLNDKRYIICETKKLY